MKTIELEGTPRTGIGKANTKHVRNSGEVPAVIYGIGEPVHISIGYNAVSKALYTPETYIVKLKVDGTTTSTIVREAQFHPVTEKILHVDFLRVSDEKAVEMELPVQLVGTSPGVLAGGKMVPLLRKLKVVGLPSQLPDKVAIDISSLGLGKTLKVEAVTIEGLKISSPPSAGIVMIEIPRNLKAGDVPAGK